MHQITTQFSSKTTQRLKENGFENLEQLAAKTEEELRHGGFNESNVTEIIQALKNVGLKLAG